MAHQRCTRPIRLGGPRHVGWRTRWRRTCHGSQNCPTSTVKASESTRRQLDAAGTRSEGLDVAGRLKTLTVCAAGLHRSTTGTHSITLTAAMHWRCIPFFVNRSTFAEASAVYIAKFPRKWNQLLSILLLVVCIWNRFPSAFSVLLFFAWRAQQLLAPLRLATPPPARWLM
jgi:hypothetical protein